MRPQALLVAAVLALTGNASALDLQAFAQCIGAQGSGTTCQLDAGTNQISSTLRIGRSNITIRGTILTSRADTVLQRAPGFTGPLVQDMVSATGAPTLTSITIRDLTVDGNRALNTQTYSAYAPEVNIFSTASVLVTNCAFLNSPNISLAFYGDGTAGVVVNNSYFGNPVIYGLWSDAVGNQSAPAYQMCGSVQFVDGVIVGNSTFENSGEPAILGEFLDLQLLNNTFTNNHSNSIPFDDDGGQIDLTTCTANAAVIGNTFQNGSTSPNGHVAGGIELHGTDLTIANNLVVNNVGGGIDLDGAANVFIANWNPATGTTANGGSGIAIAHSLESFRPTSFITIDSAVSANNTRYGIWSDTSNTTPDTPVTHLSITNTCLSGNGLKPTYFVNLGSDVVFVNNPANGSGSTSGSGTLPGSVAQPAVVAIDRNR